MTMPPSTQQPSNLPPPYSSASDTEEGSSADEEYRQSLRAPGVDLTRVRVRPPLSLPPTACCDLSADWCLSASQSAQDEELPLPDGWIRQYDLASVSPPFRFLLTR